MSSHWMTSGLTIELSQSGQPGICYMDHTTRIFALERLEFRHEIT